MEFTIIVINHTSSVFCGQEGPLLIYVFPLSPQVEFSLDGRSQFWLLPAKGFNQLDSHQVFNKRTSKEAKPLVTELKNALKDLDKLMCSSSSSSSATGDSTLESTEESAKEKSKTLTGKRKRPSTSTGMVKLLWMPYKTHVKSWV